MDGNGFGKISISAFDLTQFSSAMRRLNKDAARSIRSGTHHTPWDLLKPLLPWLKHYDLEHLAA